MRILEYIDALPDSYPKDPASVNYRFLQLMQGAVQRLRDDNAQVADTRDIHKATGKTLDLYGKMYNQPRGSMTDEQYRYIILQRIARNMVKGDYNSIVQSLAVAFGVAPDQLIFEETENPAEVDVRSLPFSVLSSAGITAGQIRQIIGDILPAGVRLVDNLNLEGTFEFAATANEYDENAGFGNIAQTIGGHFGMMVTDDIVVPD